MRGQKLSGPRYFTVLLNPGLIKINSASPNNYKTPLDSHNQSPHRTAEAYQLSQKNHPKKVNISGHNIQKLHPSEQLMKIDTRRSPPEPADKQPKKAERALLQVHVKDRAVYTIKQENGLCNVHQTAEIFDKKGKPSYTRAVRTY
jgi:hypothetical protein